MSGITDPRPRRPDGFGRRGVSDIIDGALLALFHGSQRHWLAAFVHASTLETMTEAHLKPALLYGLRVDEALNIDLLGYEF